MTGVVLGVLVFVWAGLRYRGIESVERALAELIRWIPDWLTGTMSVVYAFGAVYALGLLIAVLLQWKQRSDAVRDVLLSLFAAALISTLAIRLTTDSWPVLPVGADDPLSQYPIFRVALVTAVVLVVAPHLTRPLRRVGWMVIVLVALTGLGIGFGLPSSAVGAVALGMAASSSVLLIFGSPRGYPDLASIGAALAGLDVDVINVRLDDDQSWGVRRLIADSEAFGRVEIKAYGRDATDSQLFARAWRYLWYRDTEPSLMLTRMQSVEHEALVTMMAERTGASVTGVLAAGLGGDDLAILAVDRSGRRLSEVDPNEVTDEDLIGIWTSVGLFHGTSISHGGLDASAISITEDGHQIGDFGAGSLAAPPPFPIIDTVELLFSLAQLVGVDRAVAGAKAGLGEEFLSQVVPYIQTPAVSAGARRETDKPKVLISEIRDEVARVAGVEVEEPIQIRRVTGRSVLMLGLTLFAAYFLISMLGDIDFVAVWEEVKNADWAWIMVAFFVAQLVYFPQATAMLAAVGYPIPLRPVMILQSASLFISLAVPSSAGRIAMTAAFLRKYGVSITASLVQGSIDTISGLIVEAVILGLAFLFGGVTFGLSTEDTNWGLILLVIIVLVVVAVLLVRRVQKLRDWVMPVVGETFAALGGVLKDAKRALGLMASAFGSRFVLAVSMWFILLSLNVEIGIWEALTAVVAAGLLAGVVPVPGGIGVAEAVLTSFLVLFGVDETTAFAAAVVYRVVTFYIPSAFGYFSMKWLEKNGYI